MAYTVQWLLENRVALIELYDVLSLSEAREASIQITDYVVTGQAPVHLIVDMRELEHSPSNIQGNIQMTRPYLSHPNMGWIIIIGGNPLIQFMATVISRLTNLRLKRVSDYDEALIELQELDISVHDLLVE